MKQIKVQTGLRIPEPLYNDLQSRAARMGISINSLVLMLVELGITLLDKGVIPQQAGE